MIDLKFNVGQDFFQEEYRELLISKDMKQVWAVELDLLFEFDRVCKKNGIRWFIDGGSLLGAVRHKGFVPWDDDIDVCLFREDYERLCNDAATEFQSPYFLQTYETDLGFAWGHAVLRNSETTAIPKRDLINGVSCRHYNQGISLDIFPMDNIPNDVIRASRFLKGVHKRIAAMRSISESLTWGENLTMCRVLSLRGIKNVVTYLGVMSHLVRGHWNPLKYVAEEHDQYVQQFNEEQTQRCCTIAHWPLRKPVQYYKREWFDKTVYLDFEMLKVPAPAGYEFLLSGLYGDWHKHIVGASLHGGIFYDAEKSYRNYQR